MKLAFILISLLCADALAAFAQKSIEKKTLTKSSTSQIASNSKNATHLQLDTQAEAALKKGLINDAESLNNNLYKLAASVNDSLHIINAHNRAGLISMERGNYADAIQKLTMALNMSHSYTYKTAEINSNLGSVYLNKGDKEEASKYFFKALELYEKLGNMAGIGEAYSNISSLHYLMGSIDKAIAYQIQSIAARETINDKNGLVITHNNLSQLYLLKGNNEASLIQAEKGLTIAEILNNTKLLGVAYGTMTTYYSYTKLYNKALYWQSKAIKMYETIDDKQQLSRLYVTAANLSNAMKDSVLALSYFDKALAAAQAIGNKENIGNVYEKLSTYYASHNDYNKALNSYKTYLKYKDSIQEKSNLAKIEEIKTIYETAKKNIEINKLQVNEKIKTLQLEKQNAIINGNILLANKKETEIQLLSKEASMLAQQGVLQKLEIAQRDELLQKQELITKNNQQQIAINKNEKLIKENEIKSQKYIKNLLIIALIATIIFTILIVNRLQLKRKINQQNALLLIRNNISNDLHDEIGSTLTSISILSKVSNQALDTQPLQAKAMILQIAAQTKTIQQSMSDIVWSIRTENDSVLSLTTRIREYVALTLEPINIISYVHSTIDEQKLTMKQRKEILLICKEAINNIAKHSKASNASVSITKNNTILEVCITDNGIWKGTTTGTGTKSMKERAASIAGNLNIISNHTGTTIILKVPIP